MLSVIVSYIMAHVRSERGQDLIEYALLGGLIALAIIAGVLALSGAISSMAQGISDCIDFKSSTPCNPF